MNRTPFRLGVYLLACILTACTNMWAVTSAEEYYAIGMAYFDTHNYPEAEKWLNRAKAMDKTKTASEYNLGRIAFETKRYDEAYRYFSGILKKDPDNVMALKAAAYTNIKLGDLKAAEDLYRRVLALTPESADDGYNYALILYIMEKYDQSEAVLAKYPFGLLENSDVILLYARIQRAQDKSEAMDSYARWLETNDSAQVRYEYALLLESHSFYARALEHARAALKDLPADSEEPKKPDVHYAVARLLLIADPDSEEGIAELKAAVAEGFNDQKALETLANREGVVYKDEIRQIADEIKAPQEPQQKQEPQKQEP